jgi:hypothetical protein
MHTNFDAKKRRCVAALFSLSLGEKELTGEGGIIEEKVLDELGCKRPCKMTATWCVIVFPLSYHVTYENTTSTS